MDRARPNVVGRYALYETLGAGGLAEVYLGVDRGGAAPALVAIKRLHADRATSAAAVASLVDEVRIARRVDHPNVVRPIDFVSDGAEMLAVMEYVHGEPLHRLLAEARRAGSSVPTTIVSAIVIDVLAALDAAHHAVDEHGIPLGIVHRDVTPENVLVGADGSARLGDFGVAKAEGRLQVTTDGGVRGKLAYLAPEQLGGEVSPRTDVYAAGLVAWEMLVGERLIDGATEAEMVTRALDPRPAPPSTRGAATSPALDAAVLRALAPAADDRFDGARAFAEAIAAAVPPASIEEVAAWVVALAGPRLAERAELARSMLAAESAPESVVTVTIDAPTVVRGPASARRGPPASILVAGVVLAVSAAAAVVLALGPASAKKTPPAEPSAILEEPRPPASSVPLPSAPESSPTAIATFVPPPPSSIEPPPSAPPPSAAPRPTLGRVPPKVPGRPKCDPPFVVDSRGIRRYDPECVR